jgi:gamma-glutamylcyclotransferase (GGCT)/AIG2-like uncharacterized protein YtfP
MAPEVIETLIGRVPTSQPARLVGYRRQPVKFHVFPGLTKARKNFTTTGVLYSGLGGYDMHCLDWFEGPQYYRETCTVEADDGKQYNAVVYLWISPVSELEVDTPWSYENFRENHMERYLRDVVAPCREELDAMTKAESGDKVDD